MASHWSFCHDVNLICGVDFCLFCLKDGKIEIYNENFFKTLDDLELEWFVGGASGSHHHDGNRPEGMTFGHGGTIAVDGIAPQQRKVITIEAMQKVIERVPLSA